MNKVNKLIVETFEQENPSVCDLIKDAVLMGESRRNFEILAKSVINTEPESKLTLSIFMIAFDYYHETLKQ